MEQGTNIADASHLMFPLQWNGQTYLTSAKLHADYVQNAVEQGENPKYRRHDNYLRVIKSIPNYALLIDQKDIVVADKKWLGASNDALTQKLSEALRPFFAANDGKRLTLLNRTAQLELTHHLDDLLNHEIAYRHSQQGAQEEEGWFRRLLRETPSEFSPKFQGEIAAQLNALHEKTLKGEPKLPTDRGSERVAGVVPNRIRQAYERSFGTTEYDELKRLTKEHGLNATHRLVDDMPLDMMRGMMLGLSMASRSDQHYDDMLEAATRNRQLCMPYRWPQLTEGKE